MTDETQPKTEKTPAANAEAAKPAAKKEKGPSVENKPFAEFIKQDYLPALETALTKQGVKNLTLSLEQEKLPIKGLEKEPPCWQVIGSWGDRQRQFNVYFLKEDIQGLRAFSCTENGIKTSVLEPFLCDERKISLDLLVFGVVQRLNAQKWLARN